MKKHGGGMYKKTTAAVCARYQKAGAFFRTVEDEKHAAYEMSKDESIRQQELYAQRKRFKVVKKYEAVDGEGHEHEVSKAMMTDALSGAFKVIIVQNSSFFYSIMQAQASVSISKGIKIGIYAMPD